MLRVTTLYAGSAAATAKYYTRYLTKAPGEQPGRWTGNQAAGLGLTGEVSTDALELLLSGRDPLTGTTLGSPSRNTSTPSTRGATGPTASRSTANVSSPQSHPCITTHHTSQPTARSNSWTPPFAGPPSKASNSSHHDSQPSSRCGSTSTFDLATGVGQARPQVLPQPARYRRAIFARRATRPRGRSRRVAVVRRTAVWPGR